MCGKYTKNCCKMVFNGESKMDVLVVEEEVWWSDVVENC